MATDPLDEEFPDEEEDLFDFDSVSADFDSLDVDLEPANAEDFDIDELLSEGGTAPAEADQDPLVPPTVDGDDADELAVAQPRYVAVAGGSRLLPTIVAILCVANLGLFFLFWRGQSRVENALIQTGNRLAETADEMKKEVSEREQALLELASPLRSDAPGNKAGSNALEHARELVEKGELRRARTSIYALLAVCDRFEPETRDEIEIQGAFLLAEALRREAGSTSESVQ